MRRLKFIFLFLLLMVFVVGGFFVYTNKDIPLAEAGIEHNVYGWAWNDMIGWISFNKINCDGDNNNKLDEFCGGDNINGPDLPNYGVNIEEDGSVTGYAWSETVGYINFEPLAPYPVSLPDVSVTFDEDTRLFYGWATTSDGNWISFATSTEAYRGYGVSLGRDNEFEGYAWSDDFGWISMNARNCDANRNGYVDNTAACGGDDTNDEIGNYAVAKVTNVTGFAWSGNFGWISMNCDNNGVQNCSKFYGVNIEPATYSLGGYAWSDTFGWLSFEEDNPPDYSFNSNCISTCNAANFCTACLGEDLKLYGWAKADSLGEHGWLRLNDDDVGTDPPYGVSYNGGELMGYSWGGSDITTDSVPDIGLGWVSFNCKGIYACNGGDNAGMTCTGDPECASGGGTCDEVCDFAPYGVLADITSAPEVKELTAPHNDRQDVCGRNDKDSLYARFEWKFEDNDLGATGTAYQLIVNRDSDGAEVFNSGQCDAAAYNNTKCQIDFDNENISDETTMSHILFGGQDYDGNGRDDLDYNETYHWEVKVWDNDGEFSEFTGFDRNVEGHKLTTEDDPDGAIDLAYHDGLSLSNYSTSTTFTTFRARFPNPDNFVWFTPNPSDGEIVLFLSQDRAEYGEGNACTVANCGWFWEPGADGANVAHIPPPPATASSSKFRFDNIDEAGHEIQLTVTEKVTGDDYACSTSTTFDVNKKLPYWIEGR